MTYEDLQGRLFGLLIRLDDRIRQVAPQLHEYIEVGEFGLALEDMTGVLAYTATPIADDERSDILSLALAMDMDDMVPHALDRCPRSLTAGSDPRAQP